MKNLQVYIHLSFATKPASKKKVFFICQQTQNTSYPFYHRWKGPKDQFLLIISHHQLITPVKTRYMGICAARPQMRNLISKWEIDAIFLLEMKVMIVTNGVYFSYEPQNALVDRDDFRISIPPALRSSFFHRRLYTHQIVVLVLK